MDGTALHWAVLNGHEAVVKLLVEAKADTNVKDNFGRMARRCTGRPRTGTGGDEQG